MNNAGKKTNDLFDKGFFCAESVVTAIALEFGIETSVLPAIATGFCGGMSRNAQMCGAVTGGIMGIGLILGRTHESQTTDACYKAVNQFLSLFEEKHGTSNCKELIGFDLGIEEELKQFSIENPGYKICKNFSIEAATMVCEVIKSN
jgi:C_GCAxxG_C_C family probable redox protein